MRRTPSIFLALLFPVVATSHQQAPKATEDPGFVLGVNTYFDFGPPFDYYEIFILVPTKQGSKVEKFTLTPPAHSCYAPEKTEYVEKTSTLSVKELLAGVDPCKIPQRNLEKEQKRKKKELNFSGANVSLQIACGETTRTIKTSVLERDWFLAHPGTPKNTSWTVELLGKLRELTGPSVMDKPMFAMPESASAAPLSADPASLESLKSGKYDALFPGAKERASEIYRASLILPPKPSVTLLSSKPIEPVQFTLPVYPRLAWMAPHEGEPWVVARLDAQGNVSSVDMSGGLFSGAVADAVKQCKFPPARPSTDVMDPPREVTVTFSFELNCKVGAEEK